MTGSRRPSFFEELKERRVVRAVVVYGVAAWLAVQVADVFFPALNLPPWSVTLVAALAVLGFPVTVALAWVFDRGPGGLSRTSEPAGGPGVDGRLVSAVGLGMVIGLVVVGAGTWSRTRAGAGPGDAPPTSSPAMAASVPDSGIVVLPFADRTGGESSLAELGAIVADYVTNQISRNALGWVVPSQMVGDLAGDRPEGEDAIAYFSRASGARFVATGSYYQQGSALLIQAEITDARSSELLASIGPVEGTSDDPMAAVRALADQALVALARIQDPDNVAPPTLAEAPSYSAYRHFTRGLELWIETELDGALEAFYRALAEDSTYGEALYQASVTEWNTGDIATADSLIGVAQRHRERMGPWDRARLDWLQGWFDGDWDAVYRAGQRISGLTPSFPDCRGTTVANRLREAVAYCEVWVARFGERPLALRFSWADLTFSLHQLGEHEAELEHARRARRLHPGQELAYRYEALALAALGRLEELRSLLEQARGEGDEVYTGALLRDVGLDLRVHGHAAEADDLLRESVRWYAERDASGPDPALALYAVGDLGAARDNCERWLEENPEPEGAGIDSFLGPQADCVGLAGAARAALGDTAAAAAASEWLAARADRPYAWGWPTLNRAYIALGLGERDEGVRLIRAAHEQWIPYADWWAHFSPLLDLVRGYPPFERLVAPIE